MRSSTEPGLLDRKRCNGPQSSAQRAGLSRVYTLHKARTAWGKNEPSAQVRAAGRSLVMSKIFSKMLVGTGSNRSGSME